MSNTVSRDKFDALGIEAICEAVRSGSTLLSIAESQGASWGSLSKWIADEDDRSVRVREARIAAAQLWDEMSVKLIKEAPDAFELAKAKEIAYHYRWRASKIAPRDYGDKQTIDINDVTPKTPEQVEARLKQLVEKASKAEDQ